MPWKVKEVSYKEGEETKTIKAIATDQKGNPIWVKDDETETGVDAEHYFTKIPELITDVKNQKAAKKAAEEELQNIKNQFEGIEDVGAAKKALEQIKNIKDKKLIEAGKLEEVKAQMQEQYNEILTKKEKEWETKYNDVNNKYGDATKQIHGLTISNTFKSSSLLTGTEKIISVPVEMVENYFGPHFKPEVVNGKLQPVGYIGDKAIMSGSKPGEYASFDEAIMHLINQSPFKEQILAGANNSGGGSDGANDKNLNGSGTKDAKYGHIKTLNDFKSQKEKVDYIKAMGRDAYTKIINNTRMNPMNGQSGG